MIPTSVVRAHDVGESARSAIKLLAASSDDQFVVTSCTHATVRNYVVSQLTTGNAPRPGVLVNMTVANVMSAAQVDDDHYVVSVGRKSADLTTENLLILFTAGHWDSHLGENRALLPQSYNMLMLSRSIARQRYKVSKQTSLKTSARCDLYF